MDEIRLWKTVDQGMTTADARRAITCARRHSWGAPPLHGWWARRDGPVSTGVVV